MVGKWGQVKATKGIKGICPCCGAELCARCGDVKVNHWAHKGNHDCDPWWENETIWHRSWKDKFSVDWQEVVYLSEAGEKHIADVKTESGWTLEFQHSYLKPEERRARNAFYPKLVWIVDGNRRPTDKIQFNAKVKESKVLTNPPFKILQIYFPGECRLLKEWHNDDALVFFDFQESRGEDQAMLWFLFPGITDKKAYLMPLPRNFFIDKHLTSQFDDFIKKSIIPIHKELIGLYQRSQR